MYEIREGLIFYTFPREENLKQQWLIKIKRTNIQSIWHVRICHVYCFSLNPGWERLQFQLPLNKTFFPTPDPSFIDDWSSAKEQKLTKQYFLPPPHRFSSQSSQYQNWKLNKYSILTVIDIEAPVSESSNRISKFYASTVLITNLMKPELKMATHRIQSGLD